MLTHQRRALVTGGAGLIGSHVVDLLLREGWTVRILDNLELQTHRKGKPAWVAKDAEFREGDLCDRATMRSALQGIDVVFHQAAYGGYMPEKVDQEKLTLLWGRQVGIPTVALRYSCTYGPRQSIFNPYTGVIAIFCTRLLNNLPPVLYEDGEQTRDFSFVEDIARANLLTAETDKLDGLPVNVGSGRGVSIRKVAELISEALDIHIAPEAKGEFRPGEMRHLTSGTDRIRAAGYEPQVDLANGIGSYLEWIRQQADVRDYFSEAASILQSKGIVHRVKEGNDRGH